MKELHIYIGESVEGLEFSCGGGPKGLEDGRLIYWIDSTHRILPETGKHPNKFINEFINDLKLTIPNWNVHVNTHSKNLINAVSELVAKKYLPSSKVFIWILDDDNNLSAQAAFDDQGYIYGDWPYGCLDWKWEFPEGFKGFE